MTGRVEGHVWNSEGNTLGSVVQVPEVFGLEYPVDLGLVAREREQVRAEIAMDTMGGVSGGVSRAHGDIPVDKGSISDAT
jgi:hypothetical protein